MCVGVALPVTNNTMGNSTVCGVPRHLAQDPESVTASVNGTAAVPWASTRASKFRPETTLSAPVEEFTARAGNPVPLLFPDVMAYVKVSFLSGD